MVKCKNCGGNVHFDPGTQMIKCDYCDSSYPVEETRDSVISKEDGSTEYESMSYTCPMCGAEILQDRDTAVTFCSYCGSNVELSGRLVQMKAPSYVIPFQKTKEEAEEAYRKYIKRCFFAPSALKKEIYTDKIRGIYMPYWIYEMECHGEVAFDGSRSYRRGDYILTDHYKLNTRVDASYHGLAHDAASAYLDELSEAAAPYDVRDSKVFYPGYISGFYADAADVDAEVYADDALQIAGADITLRARRREGMSRYNISEKDPNAAAALKVTKKEMAYFPVWFMAIRNKSYVSYAVVNGQNGNVAADVPVDYFKFLIGSVIVSIPIMIVLDLFVSLRPRWICAITLLFALISMFLSNHSMNRIYTRRNYYDDQGVQFIRNRNLRKQLEAESIFRDGPESQQWNAGNHGALPGNDSGNSRKKATAEGSFPATTLIMVSIIIFYVGMQTAIPAVIVTGVIMFTITLVIQYIIKVKEPTVATVGQPTPVLSQPFSQKIPILIKPIIAIALAVILFFINPWQDWIVYTGIFIIMIPVILSYIDVLRLHNQLTRRMPRQFDQRAEEI